jgi:hypothetical protein
MTDATDGAGNSLDRDFSKIGDLLLDGGLILRDILPELCHLRTDRAADGDNHAKCQNYRKDHRQDASQPDPPQ